MKKVLFLFIIIVPLIVSECGNHDNSEKSCIEYIDSLRIVLDDNDLRVAIITPDIKIPVRPYAFIYDEHLIVLNKADSLNAFTLDCFERDNTLEKELNSKLFKRIFVLENALYGINNDNNAFFYNSSIKAWEEVMESLPFNNKTPIYEDDNYSCYSVCHGEFGGAVFFYNKQSRQITFMPSACTVCVMKKKEGYYIVSNLSHKIEYSSIVGINDPDSLFRFPHQLYVEGKWDNMHEKLIHELTKDDTIVNSHNISYDFKGNEKLISAGFIYRGNHYFLTQLRGHETFLTKLRYDSSGIPIKNETSLKSDPGHQPIVYRNDELDIIPTSDIIFHHLPASHGERTNSTNGITLINYTLFGNEPDDWPEYPHRSLLVTTFIQRDSSLIRIEWPKGK